MTATQFGRYELQDKVGEGAYGAVYRAHDTLLDRTVAIKLLNKDVSGSDDYKSSLIEAKTLAKLNHPNIVTLFEIAEHDGQTAMVMEYLEGEPLRDYLARVEPSFDDKLALARQIADALKASHSLGIVHADIKPGNIIMRADGVPVLVDFGLAKSAASTNDMETLTKGSLGQSLILGTLPYMAPEVMKAGTPDEVSDIFSFGTVLYEMLTGVRAFKAASDAEIVHLILNEDPTPVSAHTPDVPSWCANLVARMLSKERAGRPQSFEAVLKAMDTADAGTPLQDKKTVEKAQKAIQIRWMAAAIILIAALGLGYIGANYIGTETVTVHGRIQAGMDRLRHSQEKGAIEQAKAHFQSVLAEDPENAAATAGYSLALLKEYSNEEADPTTLKNAKAAADLALNLDDQLALAQVAAAWANEFSGNTEEAQGYYKKALNLDPANYFALQGLGRFFMMQGKLEQAIEQYKVATDLYPEDGWLLTLLGDMHHRNGNYNAAESLVLQGIELAPDNIHAYRTLSGVLFAKGDTVGAISAAQRGLQIKPDPMLYNNLGAFYFALGQYGQSANAFERAIDTQGNSHNYLAWANLGDAYSMIPGKEEDRKLAFRRAIQLLTERLKPDDTRHSLISRAGLYYAKAGQIDQAEKMTSRALELAPDNRWVLFRAAVVMEQASKRNEALALLERSIKAGQAISEIKNDPYLAALRQDPTYHKLLASQPSE